MKKVNSMVLVVITLLTFIFTSCTSDDDLNSAKTIYLPRAAMYVDSSGETITIKFDYDSIGRLTAYHTISRFSVDGYGFTYDEKGLINRVNYLSSNGYEKIYYDVNDKISGIYNHLYGNTVDYFYNKSTNSYKWGSGDEDTNNSMVYLNQSDDRIHSIDYAEVYYDYTEVKGVFSDLQKQPYFHFFYKDDFVTQYMSSKALKTINIVEVGEIRCDYVLNELGYPVEVNYSSDVGEFLEKVNYTYVEITVN
ncbi:hypothetical protein UMM65_14500 [Aureibaculum sp. 2210JD6-5]|uniref:hypothetical protein n=1 Tax=Aureibaculum sp. 2210JD6-5 TaxID=3103957 RepID=UPI002AAEF4DE|nr:hypothetical protein [Aureibaculum sp. 2210JD6-5]MDY7396458.1 hypothetical protein [Aureibaculum sp. 2210JD6-5]